MESRPVIGVLLAVTGVIVLVPTVIQMARAGYGLRQLWGQLVFAAGMLLVGAAYGLLEGSRQAYLALAGFLLAVLGMIGQQRRQPK